MGLLRELETAIDGIEGERKKERQREREIVGRVRNGDPLANTPCPRGTFCDPELRAGIN